MKIDIHTHTKKIKSGDAETRNIDVTRFTEIMKTSDVKILAITNHNHFDLDQYNAFRESLSGVCDIWPGIELDILEEARAHLIVIVNPKNVVEFSKRVISLIKSGNEEKFTTTLKETVDSFDNLDPIYISHYHSKKPNLSDDKIEDLLRLMSNKKRLIKEATNAISAGIYISHGHNSIYGSDIQNWDDYLNVSRKLPDLRLPVESYEQFCLLLEKDVSTISTILDKKSKESIQLNPFGPAELVEIEIFNDINIVFGSKGTGKTEILRALAKFYSEKGIKTEIYESTSKKLEEIYDTKGVNFNPSVNEFGIEDCKEELSQVRLATEQNVTSISAFQRHFESEETNRISRTLAIKDIVLLDEATPKRQFEEIHKARVKIAEFMDYISDNTVLSRIDSELLDKLKELLAQMLIRTKADYETKFIDTRSTALFNNLVRKFVSEISRKTGQPEKPTTTGFHNYSVNRMEIERKISKLIANMSKKIEVGLEYVGDLDKGKLFCKTRLVIQDGFARETILKPCRRVNKTPQQKVASQLQTLLKHVYSNSLFEKLSEFNEIENGEQITCISDLLLFNRAFTLDGEDYSPSSGEASMVLLHKELSSEKEIFIIDEPEKSLGNDYISKVIVPLLKEIAQSGKKVIIATHDANIAVRTLPYNSIYRFHGPSGYLTYVGNPFTNNLNCTKTGEASLDWKDTSMNTLEGGKEAFGERGKIYGSI